MDVINDSLLFVVLFLHLVTLVLQLPFRRRLPHVLQLLYRSSTNHYRYVIIPNVTRVTQVVATQQEGIGITVTGIIAIITDTIVRTSIRHDIMMMMMMMTIQMTVVAIQVMVVIIIITNTIIDMTITTVQGIARVTRRSVVITDGNRVGPDRE